MCTTVVVLPPVPGPATVIYPARGQRVEEVVVAGVSEVDARRVARAMARFDDPEVRVAGAGLPDGVHLLPLLGIDDPTPEAVGARWDRGGRFPPPATPIGVSEDGVFSIDLVRDGPHGLVGGTTGSGKGEFLRSLVAGLAASSRSDHLTFVLVDYKGGSAFEQCSQLPHTVGFVTDLDEQLGQRALRCLEAELSYRERVLREASASDLRDYHARGRQEGHPTLPRLLVVIDEFATMAAELPDFIGSLAGIAFRGRSLGVHMLLATQRPAGVVSENVKENTNLRIALRSRSLRVRSATGYCACATAMP